MNADDFARLEASAGYHRDSFPRPARLSARGTLLALCGQLRDCVGDLETQACEAPSDAAEIAAKLRGIREAVAEAEAELGGVA